MTRKSNAFQKAIFYIHDQLKDSNAIVTESAEIGEGNLEPTIKREIDVLIEKRDDNKVSRIAIECRDRMNTDDIQWIDCLIGKYINLPVDRIIAVSKSGFTKSATKKANAFGIELRTLKEITSLDWKSEFQKLGFCELNMSFRIERYEFNIEGNPQIKIVSTDKVSIDGRNYRIKTFIKWFIENDFWDKINLEFKNKVTSLYRTKKDLDSPAQLTKEFPLKDVTIIHQNIAYKLISFKIIILGLPRVIDTSLATYSYQDSLISTGSLAGYKQDEKINIFITQALPEDKFQLSIEKKKKTKSE